jgi:O-antigen ligase
MKIKKIFIVFAIFFIVSAGYHFVALFFHVNDSPLWRNLLFVVINIFTAYCLLKRPPWFIYLFVILMIQQLYSHGTDLVSLWNSNHRIDWMSLAVIVIMPGIFVFLLLDKIGKLK